MIINDSYFIGEIYIPHAKSDVSDTVTGAKDILDDFIEEYESDCLLKSLGYSLNKLFQAELDSNQTNGLKVTADAKWDDLLNGKEYSINGRTVYWKGIRYSNNNGITYKSFLANYVYFYYLKNEQSKFSNQGTIKNTPSNAINVSSSPKATSAWRRFIKHVQNGFGMPNFIQNRIGYGIDWYSQGNEINLYSFINDMNNLAPDTYPSFEPIIWDNLTEFGI